MSVHCSHEQCDCTHTHTAQCGYGHLKLCGRCLCSNRHPSHHRPILFHFLLLSLIRLLSRGVSVCSVHFIAICVWVWVCVRLHCTLHTAAIAKKWNERYGATSYVRVLLVSLHFFSCVYFSRLKFVCNLGVPAERDNERRKRERERERANEWVSHIAHVRAEHFLCPFQFLLHQKRWAK